MAKKPAAKPAKKVTSKSPLTLDGSFDASAVPPVSSDAARSLASVIVDPTFDAAERPRDLGGSASVEATPVHRLRLLQAKR
jgi:hypothetical protein